MAIQGTITVQVEAILVPSALLLAIEVIASMADRVFVPFTGSRFRIIDDDVPAAQIQVINDEQQSSEEENMEDLPSPSWPPDEWDGEEAMAAAEAGAIEQHRTPGPDETEPTTPHHVQCSPALFESASREDLLYTLTAWRDVAASWLVQGPGEKVPNQWGNIVDAFVNGLTLFIFAMPAKTQADIKDATPWLCGMYKRFKELSLDISKFCLQRQQEKEEQQNQIVVADSPPKRRRRQKGPE